MIKVKKELYAKHPRHCVSVFVFKDYVNPTGLELR